MKRNALVIGVLSLALLAGCGSSNSSTSTTAATQATDAQESTSVETTTAQSAEDKEIVVGATPSPHAEILEAARSILEASGYTLKIVEYNDYIQPNTALDAGELDANFFQHYPYLEDFNSKNGTTIVSAAAIHYEPLGIYAGKTKSLDALADGATVAVPNDTTNEARALLLLQANGLITLKEGAGLSATKNDIAENPKNLKIQEVEAAQVPRSLQDVDIAVINGNYALAADLTVNDALAKEEKDSEAAVTYANIIAVRAGEEKSDKILALIDAIESDEVRTFIEDKYEGAVVPLF